MYRRISLRQVVSGVVLCGSVILILQYFHLLNTESKLSVRIISVNLKAEKGHQQKNTINNNGIKTKFHNNNSSFNTSHLHLKMPFDLDIVNDSFHKCFDEELDLEQYNMGYNELYNFFSMLGTVFGFIASDVKEKIDILDKFRDESNELKEHYQKTEHMMLHEIQINKDTGKPLLGSRTLLRLHRALKFTSLFLEELVKLKPSGKVSAIGSDVYGKSLANFHPWLIRNAAKLAMYSLPDKKTFMKQIVPEGVEESVVVEKINRSVEVMNLVYNRMEELYTQHDLHGLP